MAHAHPVEGPTGPHPGSPAGAGLTFMILGAASLTAAGLLVAAGGSWIWSDVRGPATLGLVHLLTLGWLTAVAMGACYQLVPVLTGALPAAATTAWAQLGLYVGGAGVLVWGLAAGTPRLAWIGALVLATGVSVFLAINAGVLARAERRHHTFWWIAAAFGWLLVAATLGLIMAASLRYGGFLRGMLPQALATHIATALGGWISTLIIGVSYQLVPMFSLAAPYPGFGGIVFLLWNGAFLVGSTALWFGTPPVARGAALVAALAGLLYTRDLHAVARTRVRRRLDPGLASFLSASAYPAAILLGLALTPGGRYTTALVWLALGGWATGAVLSFLYRIMPMLSWYVRFSRAAAAGRLPGGGAPPAGSLGAQAIQRLAYGALHAGALLAAGGLATTAPAAVRAGGVLWGLAVAGLASDMVIRALGKGGQ